MFNRSKLRSTLISFFLKKSPYLSLWEYKLKGSPVNLMENPCTFVCKEQQNVFIWDKIFNWDVIRFLHPICVGLHFGKNEL